MRDVIVHYHIYKNAGTSIDACLAHSFGPQWHNFDVHADWANITSDDLYEHLLENPGLRAMSSHQARWPEPTRHDLRAHPIVFLRHPIDRIGSMYSFAIGRGEAFAQGKTLAQYVDQLLEPETGFVARSAQTLFLSDDEHLTKPPGPATEVTGAHFSQAVARLERLSGFGIVERFIESITLLARILMPTFPDLVLVQRRDNASFNRHKSLADRLHGIREMLGESRYRRLLEANEADMELWQRGDRIFDAKVRVREPATAR